MIQRPVAAKIIDEAIKDLNAAKQLVVRRKLEAAENALADALNEIAKAIKAINRQETKHM